MSALSTREATKSPRLFDPTLSTFLLKKKIQMQRIPNDFKFFSNRLSVIIRGHHVAFYSFINTPVFCAYFVLSDGAERNLRTQAWGFFLQLILPCNYLRQASLLLYDR